MLQFLQTYLRYVKDRQFPMLIPQVRVGIAERRRADFVVIIPLQYWRFKQLAIELDGAHPESKMQDDEARNAYYAEHNFEVLSLRPKEKGYFEEVKLLVERIDIDMRLAESDPWEVAVDVPVTSWDAPPEDIPF